MRIIGLLALSYSFCRRSGSPFLGLQYLGCSAIEYSMLDCPPASQTSPTSTLLNVILLLLPLTMKRTSLAEAFIGASSTDHLPRLSATAFAVCLPTLTVTFSPVSAVPHTLRVFCCCNTILLVNTFASFTSASADIVRSNENAPRISFFILYVF